MVPAGLNENIETVINEHRKGNTYIEKIIRHIDIKLKKTDFSRQQKQVLSEYFFCPCQRRKCFFIIC